MIGTVAVLGVALGLGLPAIEVYRFSDHHIHGSVQVREGRADFVWQLTIQPPFWPRYWRRLLGRPWRQQPICGQGEGHIAEACEFEHPEIHYRATNDFGEDVGSSPAMNAAVDRLNAQ